MLPSDFWVFHLVATRNTSAFGTTVLVSSLLTWITCVESQYLTNVVLSSSLMCTRYPSIFVLPFSLWTCISKHVSLGQCKYSGNWTYFHCMVYGCRSLIISEVTVHVPTPTVLDHCATITNPMVSFRSVVYYRHFNICNGLRDEIQPVRHFPPRSFQEGLLDPSFQTWYIGCYVWDRHQGWQDSSWGSWVSYAQACVLIDHWQPEV